jgi:hypothetical protein
MGNILGFGFRGHIWMIYGAVDSGLRVGLVEDTEWRYYIQSKREGGFGVHLYGPFTPIDPLQRINHS